MIYSFAPSTYGNTVCTHTATMSNAQPAAATNQLNNSLQDILTWALDHLIATGNPESIKSWFNTETDRWDRYLVAANNNPAAAWQTTRNELGNDITKALLFALALLNEDAQRQLTTNVGRSSSRCRMLRCCAMNNGAKDSKATSLLRIRILECVCW